MYTLYHLNTCKEYRATMISIFHQNVKMSIPSFSTLCPIKNC